MTTTDRADHAERERWLAFPTTRWLVSCEVDPYPWPDPATYRRTPVPLDPGGNLQPLRNLVHLAATREGAVRAVEGEAGPVDRWWRIGRHLGFDTWTFDDVTATSMRWRIIPLESSIDVTPAPGDVRVQCVDEVNANLTGGDDIDPLIAMAAGDADAVAVAVLQRAARHGVDPDAITLELTRLDVEG